MRIEKLNQTTKKNLLEDLLKRSPNSYEMYEEQVKAILDTCETPILHNSLIYNLPKNILTSSYNIILLISI